MNDLIVRIEKVVDFFSRALVLVSALGVATILALVSANHFSRTAGGHGVSGLVEYGEVLVVLVVYLPLAYAQLRKEHIAVDIVTSKLGVRARIWYESGLALLLAAFCFWIAVVTTGPAIDSIVEQEFRFGLVSVPLWPARVAIPIGFAVFGLKYLMDALIGVRVALRQPKPHLVSREA